jgi:simple sugar transport system substrate-binding protein/ribose transport system substrate-binding protein
MIIQLPNGLEDQLPAPLVTKEGGPVGDLTALAATDSTLWGNSA